MDDHDDATHDGPACDAGPPRPGTGDDGRRAMNDRPGAEAEFRVGPQGGSARIVEGALLETTESTYPPDRALGSVPGLTFTRLLIVGFLVVAAVDSLRVDMTATPVPYNYPFYVTLVHLPVAFVMLERYYDILAEVRGELVHLAGESAVERLFDLDIDLHEPATVAAALDVVAMATMYDRLAEMNMWPINVASAVKLAGSVTTSLVVVALDLGLLSLPV